MLPKRTKLNEYTINLEDGKQLLSRPIYSQCPLKLKTLKIYIETHLKTGFIRSSKSPTSASILFHKTLNNSLRLCINY